METIPIRRTKEPKLVDYDSLFCSMFGEPIYRSSSSPSIRFQCPSCGGQNSFFCNIENGLFHCFKCSYGKGHRPLSGTPTITPIQKIDPILHIKVSQAIFDICSLSDIHRDYLKSRGVYRPEKYGIVTAAPFLDSLLLKTFTLTELIKSGFVKVTRGKTGVHASIAWNKLLIPFWDGNTIITLKSRVNPYDIDEAGFTYMVAPGGRVSKHVWNHGIFGQDLIITEGEFKAICALEHGLSCVALSGVAMARNSLWTIKKLVKKHGVRRSFIIFDSDPDKLVNKIVKSHVDFLVKHIPNCRYVILPCDYQKEKMDLDLYLYRHGARKLIDLIEHNWVVGSV